jgi:large repetitive protein
MLGQPEPARATTFTTTVPGTSIVIPAVYPQAGGVVIILEGANGNVYYQFSNPNSMFQGYQNNGTPAAWQGNPFQIAPSTTITCGLQSCSDYFGGSIARMSVRFTAYDGDAQSGNFDFNDLTLRINGFDVGNWSTVATQNTNTAGTTLVSNGTGFGNNTFDTGWFQTTNAALLGNVLTTQSLTSSVFDRDPNDNYWDFRQGNNLPDPALEKVAPGVTLTKTPNKTTYTNLPDTVTYTYVLRNIGTVAINNLSVTDNKIPSSTINCAPSGGTIAVGGTVTCTATYSVTQADIDAGKITNVATSAGTPAYGSLGPLTATATVTGPPANPSFTFTKTVSPTSLGAVGSSLTYFFAIRNTGNVTLSSAVISDPSLPGLSCTVPAIAPNTTANAICTGNSRTVTQAMIDAGSVANTASATVKTPSGATPPAQQASATAAGVTITGSIALSKTSSPSPFGAVGSTVTYGFSIRNNTNVTVTGLSVNDPSLPGLTCSFASVAPGATVIGACAGNTRTVTQADIDAGQIVNTASASGSAAGTPVSANATRTTPGPAKTSSLSIVKTSSTASFNAVNDPVSYSYLVRNTGNTTITAAVTVTDNKIVSPNSVACDPLPPGGLPPNGTINCTATYLARQADIDAGGVTNSATARSGTTTSPADVITVPAVREPALTATKTVTAEPPLFNAGAAVSYQYVITNTGNTTLANPTISDNKITSVNCPSGNLAPGASKTCTATYTITGDDVNVGSVANNAFAQSGTTRSPTVTATVPTAAAPALTLAKSASPATFNAVGQTITYTFDVTNSGTAASTRAVTIADPKIGNFTCFTPTVASPFAAGTTQSCTRTYTVTQADLDAGTLTNTATVSTTFGSNNSPTTSPAASNTITADGATQTGALTTTKTVSPATGASVGDTLTYTIRVRNTGAVTISNIVITDPKFPALSCAIGTLAPNAISAAAACRATYVVTQADIDAGTVTNTATASGTNPRGDAVSDGSDPAISTFTQSSSIRVAKALVTNVTAGIKVGDTLTYRVTATNDGNVTQTNVTVSDTRITPNTRTCATIAPAATCILTGTYEVTQADVDAGRIDNQGSVTTDALPTPETVDRSTPIPANPKIALEKTLRAINLGPDNRLTAGDTIDYRFKVSNTGNVTLSNITVTDLVPAATVSGGPITLAPGTSDEATFTAQYTITQADIDAGRVSNTAKTTGNPPTGPPVSDTSDDPANPAGGNDPTIVPLTQTSSLAIVKAIPTVPSPLVLGTVISYEVTVTNDGTITQRNVVVSDPKLTPNSRTCATVLPGDTCVLTGTYSVKQGDVDAGVINNSASVRSTRLTTPETAALATPVDQSPGLSVNKTRLTANYAAVGDEVDYRYVVTNSGTVTITDAVTIDDDKIVAPRRVNCPATPASGIPPGGTLTCTATYVVTQDDIDAGFVTNIATAKSRAAGQTIDSAPDSVTVPAVQTPKLSVAKTALTTSFDAVGDLLQYRYVVTNTGNVTLAGPLTVSDDKTAVNCPALPAGGLKPTRTLTCTASYTVTQADLDAGKVTNKVTAEANGTTSPEDSATVPAIQRPKMTVEKQTVGTVDFSEGSTVDYQYIVANTGNVTLAAPTVIDDRIATVTCPAAPLAPGDSATCTASYVLTVDDIDIGSVTNNATAKSGSTSSPPDSVTIPIGATPALTLQKTAAPATFSELGETITYTFRVTNSGDVDLTRAVRITDPVIGNFTCFNPAPGIFRKGQSRTCTRAYQVTQADLDRGTLRNDASAGTTFGSLNTPINSPSDSATINATTGSQVPELTVTKTVSPATGAALGDTLSFAIRVKNTGKVTVSNVTIDDPKLPGLNCSFATLAPGQISPAGSCTGTRIVTQADIDRGSFTNTAKAAGVSPLGTPVTGSDSVTARLAEANPKLTVTKTAGRASFQAAGEAISYTFKVTNNGNVSLTNIKLTDPLIPAFDCTIAKLEPGDTDDFTCSATYKIRQADINRGSLTNTVTAEATAARKADPNDPDPSDAGKSTITGPARDPGLSLVKQGAVIVTGGRPKAGDRIAYTFKVANTGNVTIKNIAIDDPKVTIVGGPLTSLDPGEVDTATFTALYTITQTDINRGSVSNSAAAAGEGPDGNRVSDVSDSGSGDGNDPTIVSLSRLPSLQLKKVLLGFEDADGTGAISFGDTLRYRVTATNTGNVDLTNVTVSDGKLTPASLTCATVGPDETCVLAGTYKVIDTDVTAKSILNVALATSDQFNAAVAAQAQTAVSGTVTGQQFRKTALKPNIRRGETVPYVIQIRNVPLNPARVVDLMPQGFNFVAGSARVNGAAVTPIRKGASLTFDNLVPVNKLVRIELTLVATGSATTGTAVNRAQLINPATGVVIATAQASVTISPEHVFDCSDIIGKVYDDKNRNAYQDEGEPGLPGVRVATVKGLLITTDKFGRFHVACGEIPDADIGSNFIMKVDARTLPTGYRMTTENPRTVRLTRGKVTKINFGAAITRVVKLDLNGAVFTGGTELKPKWHGTVNALIRHLDREPSVLRINYSSGGESNAVSEARLNAIRDLIAKRWALRPNRYKLPIETRIIRTEGAPSK